MYLYISLGAPYEQGENTSNQKTLSTDGKQKEETTMDRLIQIGITVFTVFIFTPGSVVIPVAIVVAWRRKRNTS